MGLDKVIVSFSANIDTDFLKRSPERLFEIDQNIAFISNLPPLPLVNSYFKDKEIDYEKGCRKIRVMRVFEGVKVTREMEIERGWAEGLYAFTSEPSDFIEYWGADYGDVKGWEADSGKVFVGAEEYSEEKLRELRKQMEA